VSRSRLHQKHQLIQIGNLVRPHLYFPFFFPFSSKPKIVPIKMNCILLLRVKIIYSKTVIRNRLPSEVVESLSLEVFKRHVDAALRNMV